MSARMLTIIFVVVVLTGGTFLVTAALFGGPAPAPQRATDPDRGGSEGGGSPRDPVDITEEDLTRVLSPDSIPSIDDPTFLPRGEGGYLASREPVVALEIDGDARAYPLQIMTWHEIVNDRVGGIPVAVTYCPLCNSAVAFDRRLGGRVLEFGTSGSLYNSALVMYDRQTGSKWLHFEGVAVIGELEGARLDLIPVQILSFERFRADYPDGRILSRDTGFDRDYGQNPYDAYDTDDRPFLFDGTIDPRLPAVARVVGVEIEDEAVAFPYEGLRAGGRTGVAEGAIGNRRVVVFWEGGTASALDAAEIALGRDVGSSGVFVPRAGGKRLTFESEGHGFFDRETGSTWSLTGVATSGPLEGERLEPVPHLDTFWFAWAAHHPDTAIFGR